MVLRRRPTPLPRYLPAAALNASLGGVSVPRGLGYYVNRRKESWLGLRDIYRVKDPGDRDMLRTPQRDNLNRIIILNPKGGCGKSTLVTNIAACYATRGAAPAIMDFDPQGSAMAWLGRRSGDKPGIHGIAAYKRSIHATRSWQLRVPEETDTLLVDSAAGISHDELRELTRDSSSILVPVLPSMMDTHAASRIIADLLLVAKVNRNEQKLAVIANRPYDGGRLVKWLKRSEPVPEWASQAFGCRTWADYLLRFIVSHPAVTCAIPATTRVDHLEENMAAGLGSLPSPEVRARMVRHVESL